MSSFSQVSVSEDGLESHPAAILDLIADDKGFLIPRVELTGTDDVSTIDVNAAHDHDAVGLLVYNTISQSDVTPGFYYWNGSEWNRVSGDAGGGIDEEVDPTWIGDADDTGSVGRTGNVGVGTETPDVKLHIADDGAILAEGDYDSGWSGGTIGAGTRMMWIPGEGAFRAGRVTGTHWNTANIGSYSFATGFNANAEGQSSAALNEGTHAEGDVSLAAGWNTHAEGMASVAMGRNTHSEGMYSFAMGEGSHAEGNFSVAIGDNTEASNNGAFAAGIYSVASGWPSVALGEGANASGMASVALGAYTQANEYVSTAMGGWTQANGEFSTAMGRNTIADGDYSVAMGGWTHAEGDYSFAAGNTAEARGDNSFSYGYRIKSIGDNIYTFGKSSSEVNLLENFISNSFMVAFEKEGVAGVGFQPEFIVRENVVGIGTADPQAQFHTTGSVKFEGAGTPAAGRVLTSDANGLATWQDPAGGGSGDCLWSENGDDIYYDDGSVGIGTNSPDALLDVDGGDALIHELTVGRGSGGNEYNTAFGWNALQGTLSNNSVTGDYNVAIGRVALRMNVSGEHNTAVGYAPLLYNKHSRNTAVGSYALYTLGAYYPSDTDNYDNVAVGYEAGRYRDGTNQMREAKESIYIGSLSRAATNTGNVNQIVIGYDLQSQGNNTVTIGNDDITDNYFNGNVRADGAILSSDISLKKNINNLENSLDVVMQLQGVNYDWKKDSESTKGHGQRIGFIAQDVEKVLPSVVSKSHDGVKGIAYTELIALLTEGIKEQQEIIERQGQENKSLQKKYNELLQRIEALENK